MRVSIGIEYIGNGELANRQDDVVGRLGASQLVGRRRDGLLFSSQIDDLPVKQSWQPKIGRIRTYLVGFATWISAHTEGIAQAEPLIDFWIDPKFAAL